MDTNAQTLLLATVTAHFLVDFCLQRDNDVAAKRRLRFWAFLKHGAMQATGAYLFAGQWTLYLLPAVVFASHPLIDGAKEAALCWVAPRDARGEPTAPWQFWGIVVDQLLHLAVLVAAVGFLDRCGMIPGEAYWSALVGRQLWLKGLVLVSGVVLSVFAGGFLTGVLVQPMLEEIRGADRSSGISPERRGLASGGRRIGQLERALVLIFVLSGQPAGVGFLMGAKSILRFGELKDDKTRMEAEYVIIGTLLSFAWGLTVAWVTHWALGAV
jgi:hypothetical protein